VSRPRLSRFELQVLRLLWARGSAAVRDLHADLGGTPSYSTVKTIVERLADKGAVTRVRQEGRAWIYRPAAPRAAMLRREVRGFLDTLFGGSAPDLLAQLADMDALTIEDLREIERRLGARTTRRRTP
jgi:predicted transcriptional regulator